MTSIENIAMSTFDDLNNISLSRLWIQDFLRWRNINAGPLTSKTSPIKPSKRAPDRSHLYFSLAVLIHEKRDDLYELGGHLPIHPSLKFCWVTYGLWTILQPSCPWKRIMGSQQSPSFLVSPQSTNNILWFLTLPRAVLSNAGVNGELPYVSICKAFLAWVWLGMILSAWAC